jgi:glucose-6-phosphate isomerase
LHKGTGKTAADLAQAVGEPEQVETVYHLLEHLAANGRGVTRHAGATPTEARFAKA